MRSPETTQWDIESELLVEERAKAQSNNDPLSVAVVITNVFRKNGINVSNKFVRILKIFTKIYDIKNHRVIYAVFALRGRS